MNTSLATRLAAISGFLAVAFGAFGAHGLKTILAADGMLAAWQTGALYHLVHSVVLFALSQRAGVARLPFALFGIGIILFSGSLYAMAATNVQKLGIITPFGGLCVLGGWLALALKPTPPAL
jgi:uncharacterized membrane protein YgdD (TMEM256/DUF423 family)